MTMHWTDKSEWYSAGYEFATEHGFPTHDMSDYGNGKKYYMEGVNDALKSRRESIGIPAMTSAEMHEFENC